MLRHRLSLLCLGLVLATPAAAQIMGRPFELSGQAGWNHYDLRARMQDGPGYAGSLGWRAAPWMVLEGQAFFGPSQADTLPHQDHNFFAAGLDLRANLRPAEGRVVPYFIAGGGYASSATSGYPPDKLARGYGSLGLGMLYSLRGSPRTYLRFQVRDFLFRERDVFEFSNRFAVSVGLHYVYGGRPHDSDLDGVRDWLDRCPATPIGAKVDASGCPLDTDGDGVLDGIDQCAATTKGCTADAKGCPGDADNDGVCDGQDQCANTPEGLRVDEQGCPIEVSDKEVELLDTGMIRLQNINFDTGKATLKAESLPVLEEVAKILQQYPTLRIQIGGHTDDRGSARLNDTLSTRRAAAVLEHMKQTFPQISSSQFTSRGYGSSQPIAPNSTALGRAKNRRVEFKVLNTDALRIEREKRRFLRRDEGVRPAPAPASSDSTRR